MTYDHTGEVCVPDVVFQASRYAVVPVAVLLLLFAMPLAVMRCPVLGLYAMTASPRVLSESLSVAVLPSGCLKHDLRRTRCLAAGILIERIARRRI